MATWEGRPFLPIGTTVPAFSSSALGATAALYPLQATGREWLYPSNRSVRIVSHSASESYYAEFGDSGSIASTNSFLGIGEQPYIVHVGAGITHISLMSPSGSPSVNVSIGSWGRTEHGYRSYLLASTAASTESTAVLLFSIQEAASVLGVFWSTDFALGWTDGAAAHGMKHYHHAENPPFAPPSLLFNLQESASILGVFWSTDDTISSWTDGDAAHITGLYHYDDNATLQRGRPFVTSGAVKTVHTDTGQIIRAGEVFHVGGSTSAVVFKSTEWAANRALGLNCMRVGVNSSGAALPSATLMTRIDAVVERARENRMYCLLGYFAVTPGSFELNVSTNVVAWSTFWEVASARYKDETHVFYEMINEPTTWGNVDTYSTAIRDGLKGIYDVMRAGAPDTMIVWPSPANLDPSAEYYTDLMEDMDTRGNGIPVDYSNAALGFHYYNQTQTFAVTGNNNNATDGGEAGLRALAATYPLFCTETNWWMEEARDVLIDAVNLLEEIGIAWCLLRRANQVTPHNFPFSGDMGPEFLENKLIELRNEGYDIPIE